MHILYPILLPGGLFFTAGALLIYHSAVPLQLEPYLSLLFPTLTLVGLLVGLRFNRTRLIFSLLILGLALILIQFHTNRLQNFEILSILLPANLLLTMLLPEKGMTSNWVALFGSFLLAETLGCAWLLSQMPQQTTLFFSRELPVSLPFALPLSPYTLIASGLSVLGSLLVIYFRRNPLEAALFWTILLTVLFCYNQPDLQMSRLLFSICALILLTGLLETSHSMAYRDELTGIPGRRAFNEALERLGRRYVLAMLDIDHFKKFNDRHGHEVGDQVLKMVASKLSSVTGGGKAYRYGGEEFAVIFAGKQIEDALPQLEQLRQKIEQAAFIPRGPNRPKNKPTTIRRNAATVKALSVTISIGAAESSRKRSGPDAVLKSADEALYRAKKQGRNRVCS